MTALESIDIKVRGHMYKTTHRSEGERTEYGRRDKIKRLQGT